MGTEDLLSHLRCPVAAEAVTELAKRVALLECALNTLQRQQAARPNFVPEMMDPMGNCGVGG